MESDQERERERDRERYRVRTGREKVRESGRFKVLSRRGFKYTAHAGRPLQEPAKRLVIV